MWKRYCSHCQCKQVRLIETVYTVAFSASASRWMGSVRRIYLFIVDHKVVVLVLTEAKATVLRAIARLMVDLAICAFQFREKLRLYHDYRGSPSLPGVLSCA